MDVLDLLFPKKCVACKKRGEYVCTTCFSYISFSVAPTCLMCGQPSIDGLTHPICQTTYSIDGCFSGVRYSGVIKKLLYTFKYKPYLADLQSFLGNLLYESLIQNETYMQVALLHTPIFSPIPLSAKKLRQRGYNQSELLAKALANFECAPIVGLLERKKETTPQFGLSREERKENIKEAFKIKESVISNIVRDPHEISLRQLANRNDKYVFLVDDVVTTGSTLVEAANVLKRNGYEKVWGLTFAQD